MYLAFFPSQHALPHRCPRSPGCCLVLPTQPHLTLLPVCLRIQLRGLPWGSGGLRVCLPAQGTWVQCLVPEDSTSPVPQLLSLCATTTETQAPWSPCSETREATKMRSPPTSKEQALLDAAREACTQQQRPRTQQQRPCTTKIK